MKQESRRKVWRLRKGNMMGAEYDNKIEDDYIIVYTCMKCHNETHYLYNSANRNGECMNLEFRQANFLGGQCLTVYNCSTV